MKHIIYLNSINECKLKGCNCGANINIGFKNRQDLNKFREILEENDFIFIDSKPLRKIYEKVNKEFFKEKK